MEQKNGFNFVEVVITIIILGVIFSLFIPTLRKISVNQNEILFKKAYFNLAEMVTETLSDPDLYKQNVANPLEEGNLKTGRENITFCENLANKVDTIGEINCAENVDFNFTTKDGMRWKIGATGKAQTAWAFMAKGNFDTKCSNESYDLNSNSNINDMISHGSTSSIIVVCSHMGYSPDYSGDLYATITVDVNGVTGPNKEAPHNTNLFLPTNSSLDEIYGYFAGLEDYSKVCQEVDQFKITLLANGKLIVDPLLGQHCESMYLKNSVKVSTKR